MALANGEYTIEVTLTGGTGRATVQSPTKLTVSDRGMTAEIEWSSSNYDYMKVGEREYFPVRQEGNSLFVIDVEALDADIPVAAETVAMSRPHMIDYSLRFDSSTAKPVGGFPYMIVFCAVGAAFLAAGAAVWFRRRREK